MSQSAISQGDIEKLRAFHGHVGPYAVAGMRLGRYALARVGGELHFGCEADVYCPERPPGSCFLDGVQVSTGCTLGKVNIRHHVADRVELRLTNRRTGRTVRVRLRTEAIERAVQAMQEESDEVGAGVLNAMTEEELIEEIEEA